MNIVSLQYAEKPFYLTIEKEFMYQELDFDVQMDVESIQDIKIVPSILNVICKTTGMGFAAVSRVTEKEWVTCTSRDNINFKLKSGDQLEVNNTICNEIRQHGQKVVIEDANQDLYYSSHPSPPLYGYQSYIAVPIYRKNKDFFGTLFALDPKPVKLKSPEILDMFKMYAELISLHLEMTDDLKATTLQLREERKIAELRETFIAVLGHDLRNPVGTARMSADILLKTDLPAPVLRQLEMIKSSSYRMQELIDNLLDFAKGHLGDGIKLKLERNKKELLKELKQVVAEARALDPSREVIENIRIKEDVLCDPHRIAQLLSNLLGNALKHGSRKKPLQVDVYIENRNFVISVINGGKKIPEERINNLFKPYYKEHTPKNESGLGLGLYIVSEIAKAHNGVVNVKSNDLQTTFTFKMPLVRRPID
ncbi:GAF domain-containing sensor histidine kinase [Galbibacter mesophilus]|uniref:GAF domain-containing sensor histidine kinase n=1 Tax=Galbibacter mesophilus TaxID=379069 RepID=UPI00191D2F0F|nr:GAF domain-containing sensor histidine kinase [Galbibacter mesophilus]MCM5661579.1 GAF domain-containing sensor histidine kinase [Galbibacter mesophilus]